MEKVKKTMFNKNEIIIFLLAALIIGYLFSFNNIIASGLSQDTVLAWLKLSGLALIALLSSVVVCNIVTWHFGCDAEFRLWCIRQYGFHKTSYFKRSLPAWILFPLGFVFLTLGYVKWLALTVFDVVPTTRVGREYAEITEWELALIAFFGLFANLALAVVSKIAGWDTLASINIWFAFFNFLPISELNGAKILHGSKMLWIFGFVFTIIILILLGITHIVTTLVAAGVLALIAVVLFYCFFEKE